MVMQSGEDPAGGKDGKSAKPLPWKYIAIAAVLAASILGVFFAATTGIFSGPASIADTTASSASTGSGFSPPAKTDFGLAVTDKKDDEKSTTPTKIPNPNEITPTGTIIDISNPQEFVKANSNLVITDIEIDKSNNRIEASYLNTDPEKNTIIRPALITFFDGSKNPIQREQWCCKYSCDGTDQVRVELRKALIAHCQWPEDFCYTQTRNKAWEKYWEEKLGEKQQPQKVGSIEYKEIVPTIKANGKYKFAISCEIPSNAKYIKIT